MTVHETIPMSLLPPTPPTAVASDAVDVETLYNDFYPKIVLHLQCRGAYPDVAESLAQDTFVKAMERLGTLREPAKALAWLRQIATNLWYDRCRREGPCKRTAEKDDDTPPWDEAGPDPAEPMLTDGEGLSPCWMYSPERELIEEERRSWLEAFSSLAPMLLPPTQRRAVLLRYTEGLSYAEVGQRLGISAATARTHTQRARQHLEAFVSGNVSKVVLRPLPALQEQATSRFRAGDRIGAARSHALAGWAAAGVSLSLSAGLRDADPDGRILEDPVCRDSEEAVAVRQLLAVARQEVSQAVEVFEADGLHDEAAGAWLGLGLGFYHAELYEEARPALLAALANLRESPRTGAERRWSMAFVHRTLGCVCTGLSLFEEGLQSFRRALRIFRGLGDEEESVRTLIQGAELFVKQGDRGAARQAYRRVMKLCRRSRADSETESFIRSRLAFLGGD